MAQSKWFIHYCQAVGIPPSEANKIWDRLIKEVGSIAEGVVVQIAQAYSYEVTRRNQHLGGFDYHMVKTYMPPTEKWPKEIFVEVKANKSQLTPHQKDFQAEVTISGGNYIIERKILPLPFFL